MILSSGKMPKNAVLVKNAILFMETNQKRSDAKKVVPHMITEKCQHTEMRNKDVFSLNFIFRVRIYIYITKYIGTFFQYE
jgi:hypothetical protein